MKKVFLFVLAAGMICCFHSCKVEDGPGQEELIPDETIENDPDEVIPSESIELTLRQGEKAEADNRFTFNIFHEVSASNGTNTFFSPLSLNMALGMLYNGASGDTRTEMAEVLGMAGFTETEVNEYYQKILQALLQIDPLTEIGIANSIWYRDLFPVKQPFIDINRQYFDAMVQAIDFDKPDAAGIINQWCAEKTNDRIEEIIENPIPGDVMMYLINALYFKSQWQFEFDKSQTKQDDFTKDDNQTIKVNMMEQTADFLYYFDENLQCVEMPFGNQAFSMFVILPSGSLNINQLVDYLDHTAWQHIINNLITREVWLKLPRFRIECDIPLNDPAKSVGMELIFNQSLANFSSISDVPLFVSNIKQKTFVEVNEEGAEAAAVTVIEMAPTSSMTVSFFANRPFLYLIKEKSTGIILFIGRMDEPKE